MQKEFKNYLLNSPIQKELEAFEANLLHIINSCKLELFKDDLKAFIFSNPKRLRPILIFLFSKILKIQEAQNETVQKIALAIELIHSASLVHDDIIDDDDERRNKPAIHKLSGIKKAILIGDVLLALALGELSDTSIDIAKIISEKIEKTILGEINQNEKTGEIVSVENYIKKSFNKTGNVFMAGIETLFTLKNIDETIKKDLKDFVYNFSLAFQIKNDIENILKKNMSDIKNGNYTLAVIYFSLENSKILNKEDILNIKKDNLDKFIQLANEKVKSYKENALVALKNIENSNYKNSIIDLCNLIF